MYAVDTSIVVGAKPEDVFAILADVKAYPDFLSEVKSVNVRRRGKGWCIAAFELDMIQRVSCVLRLTFEPPKRIVFTLVEGTLFKRNEGSWTLSAQKGGKTKTQYKAQVELTLWVPEVIMKVMMTKGVDDMLGQVKARAESEA